MSLQLILQQPHKYFVPHQSVTSWVMEEVLLDKTGTVQKTQVMNIMRHSLKKYQ